MFGPLFLTAAVAIVPLGTLGDRMKWVWVAWLIDEGTWMILATLVILAVPAWRRKYMPSDNDNAARS